MTKVSVSGSIAASRETVFRAIADFENLPQTSPEIVGIEFLSAQHYGLGTRFRETRLAGQQAQVG